MPPATPWVLGLTGGIGSGKSVVADLFSRHNAHIIDTDVIAHALTTTGGLAMPALCTAFGSAIATPAGALDRTAMRQRVFADPQARQQLEAILHPLIHNEVDTQLHRLATRASGWVYGRADFSYVVLVVPLLVETGAYQNRVDRVLVVDCLPAQQIERVMARNDLTRHDVEAILAVQATREQRLASADDVICNDRDLTSLASSVAVLDAHYLLLAAKKLVNYAEIKRNHPEANE